MQNLFGGSSGSSNSQSTSASGFGALPSAIQGQISNLATSAGNLLNPSGTPNSSLFTLPALNSGSQNALSSLQNQQYAITPQSIQTDVNEQMNPYNQSVINQIEQAQNGQESQLSQYLTQAGQFGSNKGMEGASDISQQGANQIGSFLGGEYNTALQNALTTIPQQGMTSASDSVQAGQLQQSQALQNQQAPVSALSSLAQILNTGVPSTSTGQSTGSSQQSSVGGGGLFGQSGGIGNVLSAGSTALSDLATVLCTALYKQGLVSRQLWVATQRYGQQSDPRTFAGYLLWATPFAKMVTKHKWFAQLIAPIFIPPLKEEAFRMGLDVRRSLYGRVSFYAMYGISWASGRMIRKHKAVLGIS